MSWEPEKFTPEQRKAAGRAITQAQIAVCRFRFSAAGPAGDACTTAALNAYLRVEDMLSMLYDDVYGLDGSGSTDRIPQPPNAS
ncbi:MAG: hypothetical protein M3Y83_14475 [Actinomycetota bacterium]|nr:hypothetical protein [Actinomycetota bacterium]